MLCMLKLVFVAKYQFFCFYQCVGLVNVEQKKMLLMKAMSPLDYT